jgi:hypothetical protein
MNLVASLAFVFIGLVPVLWAGAVGFALTSLSITVWNILVMSLRQSVIPGRLLGRVHGTWRTLLWGSMPLGSLLGGLLGRVNLELPFIIGGGLEALACIVFFRFLMRLPNPEDVDNGDEVSEPGPIPGINAGACMLTRAAYVDVGGWDPTFFLDYEDTDISVRLWQHGWRCRIEPRALVYHAVGATNTHVLGQTSVGKKRYSCALSNQVVVALKTFTGPAHIATPALLADRMLRNLLMRRWDLLPLDVKAVELTARRLPEILRYRRANRALNHRRPGQAFFSEPAFNLTAP